MRMLVTVAAAGLLAGFAGAAQKPNIVYIAADELGYYEPGFMGGRNIRTPNLDRMAADGIRFTSMFAGSSVCAPTRCCLMTGRHAGHASIRVNGGGTPLRADEVTIASMLKPLGYATGGFGKWGCGGRGSTGVPEKHGFDVFLGYYDQVHAHTYYPPYLVRNSKEVPLPGNNGGRSGKTYSQYVIHDAALKFIRDNHDLAADPSESKDVAAANSEVLKKLISLAETAHQPVREGTFSTTDLHERDRRAKFGKQDDPNYKSTPSGGKKKSKKEK